eukprot:365880-Chlamydomonas_euryale.AAC.4
MHGQPAGPGAADDDGDRRSRSAISASLAASAVTLAAPSTTPKQSTEGEASDECDHPAGARQPPASPSASKQQPALHHHELHQPQWQRRRGSPCSGDISATVVLPEPRGDDSGGIASRCASPPAAAADEDTPVQHSTCPLPGSGYVHFPEIAMLDELTATVRMSVCVWGCESA